MAELVSDLLWELVEPLLPKSEPSLKGGRPRAGTADGQDNFVVIVA